MIAFFPEIYPDELLYSQLARYHKRSGYARYAFTVMDIYKNDTTVHPSVEFVNKYTADAMKWITKDYTWEYIIEHHTMSSAYIRFLPKLRREEAIKGLRSCEGNWKNLMCLPVLNEKRYIRYCPHCTKEDREKYGETFWHRVHQVPRIKVCPKHRCFLENSDIVISSKASPRLCDAESCIPKQQEVRTCENNREVDFTQYILDVMKEPIDLDNALSVGLFLHSRLNKQYASKSGLIRNISKFYEEYKTFYGEDMPIMEQSYMQKIFNGYHFDPYFVLQIAYLEGVSVKEIVQLPNEIPLYGIENTYRELAVKYNLEYAIVSEIGNAILKFKQNQNCVSRKSGRRTVLHDRLDVQWLPQVETVVQGILNREGRPEKVSFSKVEKALGLAQKQFNKFPKCKEYIEKHIESQAEYWAREIEWAIKVLEEEDKPINSSRVLKLTNMRIRDIESCYPYINNPRVKALVLDMMPSLTECV